MPAPISPAANLRASLHAFAEGLAEVQFGLPGESQVEREKLRERALWSINEYLLPRLGDLEAPLVVVLIGSTGSGKSTVLNSLASRRISEPGAIRPTTTMPVIWTQEDHANRYSDDFLTGYGSDQEPLRVVVGDDRLLAGVTIIDAPDFDSVVDRHRQIATDLLAVADVVVFVTSAQRYADAVPWEFLSKARDRSVPILFVANRIPADAGDLVTDYQRLLTDHGFVIAERFFEVAEQSIDDSTGALPKSAVFSLRAQLEVMALEAGRKSVLGASIRGAIDELAVRSRQLESAVQAERVDNDRLRRVAIEAYDRQISELSRSIGAGELIRREVVGRWQEFVGTGEFVKAIGEGVARVSAWMRRFAGGRRPLNRVRDDARFELRDVLVRRADLAAAAAASAWELDPAGRELLSGRSLWRHAETTEEQAEQAIEDWLVGLSELIAEAGESKKRSATVASYSVNTVAVVLILAVFLQTGGLTGAEVGVAAGAAAAQQKLLEHIFGSAAARSLIETSRERLEEIGGNVLLADGTRFTELIAAHSTNLPAEGAIAASFERVREEEEAWHGV